MLACGGYPSGQSTHSDTSAAQRQATEKNLLSAENAKGSATQHSEVNVAVDQNIKCIAHTLPALFEGKVVIPSKKEILEAGRSWGSPDDGAEIDVVVSVNFSGIQKTPTNCWLILSFEVSPHIVYPHLPDAPEIDDDIDSMKKVAIWFPAIRVIEQKIELTPGENKITFEKVNIEEIVSHYMDPEKYRWVHAFKVQVVVEPDHREKDFSDNMAEVIIPVAHPF
jgi:hypothetical protein